MTANSSYTHVFRLPAERGALFDLFADPRLLDLLTPPWFRLRPLGAIPRRPSAGSEISYRLRWRGVPLPWTSLVTDWQAPSYFAYEQKRGPYRYFRHEHLFGTVENGTEIVDRVFFRAPGGPLADRLLVGPELRRIFAYRERRARSLLNDLRSKCRPTAVASQAAQSANLLS